MRASTGTTATTARLSAVCFDYEQCDLPVLHRRDAGLAQLAGAPGNEGKFNLDGTGEKGKKRYGPPTSQHRPSGCFSNAQDGA